MPTPRAVHAGLPPWAGRPPAYRPQTSALKIGILCALLALVLAATGVPSTSPASSGSIAPPVRLAALSGCVPCAPDLFCGGGHLNLRSPYVAPPAVPINAPDGYPWGAVGPTGASGITGHGSFSAGSSTTLGVGPCGSSGCTTTISINSFWANQSISLLGNVTIVPGNSLTIYNTALTWTEPASSTATAYGFNLSSGNGALFLEHGTTVTQSSPSTTNSWFIWGNGGVSSAFDLAVVSNATINTPSAHVVLTGVSGRWERGFQISFFNYSNYNGFSEFGEDQALNVTGGASHSFLGNGTFEGVIAGNDSFQRCGVGLLGGNLGTHAGVVAANYTTLANLSGTAEWFLVEDPGIGVNTPGGARANWGVGHVWLEHDRFYNWNASYLGNGQQQTWEAAPIGVYTFALAGPNAIEVVANDSVWNIAGYQGAGPLFPTENTNADDLAVFSFHHVSYVNSTTNATCGTGGTNGVSLVSARGGTAGYVSVEFNLLNHVVGVHCEETSPLVVEGPYVQLSDNLIENQTSLPVEAAGPAGYQFQVGDLGVQVYAVIIGLEPSQAATGTWTSCSGSFATDGVHQLEGNWFVNVSRGGWGAQVLGCDVVASGNTFLNLHDGGAGLGISVNSGCEYAQVTANRAFGVYNYSYSVGSNEGGALLSYYAANVAQDVDVTSYALWTMGSSETWANEANQSLFLLNALQLENQFNSLVPYSSVTTSVDLVDSSISAVTLEALQNGSAGVTRPLFGNDFAIIVADSFVPPNLTAAAYTAGLAGTIYASASFLTVEGWLGIYLAATYLVNGAWSPTGQLTLAGPGNATVAVFPAGHYTFDESSPTSYTVTASSTAAGAATLDFVGAPYGVYSVVGAATGGTTDFLYTDFVANAAGEIAVAYVPSAEPLNATFVATFTGVYQLPSPGGFSLLASFLGLPTYVWLVLILLAVVAVAVSASRLRA